MYILGISAYYHDSAACLIKDGEIIAEIDKLSYEDINFNANESLIEMIDTEVDEVFMSASVANGNFNAAGKDDFNIVFTSLHGPSITAIPEVLKRAGYKNVTIIEEQAKPDGNFPTVVSPNPEEPEALSMAIKKAQEIGADMVVGTDPDSDRLGIAVRNLEGEMELLNGSQDIHQPGTPDGVLSLRCKESRKRISSNSM